MQFVEWRKKNNEHFFQATNGWISTDRTVLYVITDGPASDGGIDGDPLADESELLASLGVDVHVIGVGPRVSSIARTARRVTAVHRPASEVSPR